MQGTIALRRWSIRFAFAIGALCAVTAVQAGPTFSRMVVFGDSLSDTGNTRNVVGANSGLFANLAGYGNNGRFSNGVLWHETMAPLISESVATASRVTGPNNYNYAYGGARVDNAGGASTGVLTQYANYTTRVGTAGADANALYAIWAGGNDARDLVGSANPLTGITSSISALRGVFTGLIAQGATTFLVPNLPDLGKIPENRNTANQTRASNVSVLWNAALLGMLLDISDQASFYYLDVFSTFNNVLDNPAGFGFTNTTGQCRSLALFGLVESSCANPNRWVFWDNIHPTTAAHAVIGRAAANLLNTGSPLLRVPEPSALALVVLALLLMRVASRRNPKAQTSFAG